MRRFLRRAGGCAGLILLLLLGAGGPRTGGAGAEPAAAPSSATDDGAPVLIRIATDDGAALARLAETGAPAVCVRDGFALAWGFAGAMPGIRALGLQADLLTERRADRGYAFIYMDGGGRGGRGGSIERFGRVLCRGPHTAVLEYPPGCEEQIRESYFLIPIANEPLVTPPPHPSFRTSLATELDPIVAECVAQVDKAGLEAVVGDLQDFGTRRSESLKGRSAQDYIHGLFASYGLSDVSDFDYNAWCDDVVAVQPGKTAPGEIYVIGGHYDSFASGGLNAPGADDNATGTSAVLEAARIFSRQDFEATIIYIAFSGEEQGLIGSREWAAHAKSQGFDIRAMLNLDMIGYLAPGGVANLDLIFRSESSWLRDLIVQTAGVYVPDFPIVDGFLTHGDSDHTSFSNNGYYSIFFFEDSTNPTPYIHTVQDVIGTSVNDFDFMRQNVQVAVATLATMARPLRVTFEHTPVEDPPISADGYPVLAAIRSTAPLVEDSLRVRYAVDRGPFSWLPMLPVAEQPGTYGAVIPKQSPGRFVQYVIRARDIEGRVGEEPFSGTHAFTVGMETVFADSFDTDKGWTVGAPGDSATTGIWVRAAPVGTEAQPGVDAQGDSSGFCYVTGNGVPGGDPGEADVDGGRTSLTSPRFDLSGAQDVRIRYARWFVDQTRLDDTLRVFLSNDDGATWKLIDATGRSEAKWSIATIQGMGAMPPPTDRMRLRFVAEDVGGSSLVEAAIDDVVVKAVIVPPEPSPVSSRIVTAGPLPMRSGGGGLAIHYELSSDRPISLGVYDLLGRRIARVSGAASVAGRHEAAWDGRDERGRSVAAGIYFLRLDVAGESGNAIRIPVVR